MQEHHRDYLLRAIQTVAKAMKATITKQLTDFLPGGQFSKPPSQDALERTSFAHVTNLACEHHFGDLDSSQRRRPRATMHHHSSVQMIKRNREKMMEWLDGMTPEKKQDLLKTARKGGKALREAHLSKERSVLTEIHEEMSNNKKRKRKEHTKRNSKRPDEEVIQEDHQDEDQLLGSDVHENEYVAVAYNDAWYPGIVTAVKDTGNVVVKFLGNTKKPGVYQWPRRDDMQDVNVKFILRKGFIPECLNSGRMWGIPNFKEIDTLYCSFRSKFF
jgi:hypothetical protein